MCVLLDAVVAPYSSHAERTPRTDMRACVRACACVRVRQVHEFDTSTGNFTGAVFGGAGSSDKPLKFNCDHGISWDDRVGSLVVRTLLSYVHMHTHRGLEYSALQW